ncbi:MAG TPA: Do family serine endopeptidase [Steroidobacteraceae bacterium]|nr:Do family serine endopeptidase [Steroidobacteraceae bacterium]
MKRLVLLLAVLAMSGTMASRAASVLPAIVGGTPVPSLAPMVKRVSPAIVNVATRGTVRDDQTAGSSAESREALPEDPLLRRFFGTPRKERSRGHPFQSAGSGVIIDARRGYILTNAHVVENATHITVTLEDGRDLDAHVVGSDDTSDIAVLKVKPERLTQITLGDSAKVEVGDFVVAIGNPFGLHNTVTSGIVSGLGRSSLSSGGAEDFIQTDASINPGNSGGALVNLRGQLIGINTAILSSSGDNIGIGFAIPVNVARTIMAQLIAYGAVRRGILGVSTYAVTSDVARAFGLSSLHGVLVTNVIAGSAADRAGIETDDIIVSLNGAAIGSPEDLRRAVGLLHIGDEARIDLLRDGKPRQVRAVIAQAPAVR